MSPERFPWLTFTCLISFASVNAVLFTPALPEIAEHLAISQAKAEGTMMWFLIGYALGQLFYGPITERLGYKKALYIGIMVQLLASLGCALSVSYEWLACCRFFVALGAGVGLKMTFTLVNEWYAPKVASQKMAYLMLAFAIAPGLGVGLGGILNAYFGWASCFYAGAIYGVLLCFLVAGLPIKLKKVNLQALHFRHLMKSYHQQFTNSHLVVGALIMGGATCFVYVFASLAPFIAIEHWHMSSSAYGAANIIPSLGLMSGSICAGIAVKKYSLPNLIKTGVGIAFIGVLGMLVGTTLKFSVIMALFVPMMVIYFGLSFVLANASTLAMSYASDKSHASAVMGFINMGVATLVVLALGICSIHAMLLPIVFVMISVAMGITILARL